MKLKYRSFHVFIQSPQSLLFSSWEQLLSEGCRVLAELLQRWDQILLVMLF